MPKTLTPRMLIRPLERIFRLINQDQIIQEHRLEPRSKFQLTQSVYYQCSCALSILFLLIVKMSWRHVTGGNYFSMFSFVIAIVAVVTS